MKKIKFRAWDGKKMLHNVGIHPFIIQALWHEKDNKMKESDEGAYLVSPAFPAYHIMQFTGLKDRNGKEIYEGDIIAFSEHKERGGIVVEWIDGVHYGECSGYPWSIEEATFGWEVIGNIYMNTELLTTLAKG